MPKDAFYKLHKIEIEVLEGLYKLGWRYFTVNHQSEIVVYEEMPIWKEAAWDKDNDDHMEEHIDNLTPYSLRIQKNEAHVTKLVELLDPKKVYRIIPFLINPYFNYNNQENYIGGYA